MNIFHFFFFACKKVVKMGTVHSFSDSWRKITVVKKRYTFLGKKFIHLFKKGIVVSFFS